MILERLLSPLLKHAHYVNAQERDYRFSWGSLSLKPHGLCCNLHCWDDDRSITLCLGFILGAAFIRMKNGVFGLTRLKPWQSGVEYGFSFNRNRFCIGWGERRWWLWWPWEHTMRYHWIHRDGRWVLTEDSLKSVKGLEDWSARAKVINTATQYSGVYNYIAYAGEVRQSRIAYHVERREWRWRWLMWSPWPRYIRTFIDFHFDPPVHGVVGSSFAMLEGETPEQALRRMEMTYCFRH
jgi:hypothetical protein